MKINNLIKATPFLLTLLLVGLVSVSNQKQYAKLRILIWSTPSLKLGTYIAISAGTGFMVSYLINSSLANIKQSTPRNSLKFKVETEHEENNENQEINTEQLYQNTLIERDFSDPAPTINASFRIIGRNSRGYKKFINNNKFQYNDSIQYEENYNEQPDNAESTTQEKPISFDWNDDSYSRW